MANLRVIHTVPAKRELPARPLTPDEETLWTKSYELWPTNNLMRLRWLGAVNYLRNHSRKGWIIDTYVMKHEV